MPAKFVEFNACNDDGKILMNLSHLDYASIINLVNVLLEDFNSGNPERIKELTIVITKKKEN